jgi:hypothetical protein
VERDLIYVEVAGKQIGHAEFAGQVHFFNLENWTRIAVRLHLGQRNIFNRNSTVFLITGTAHTNIQFRVVFRQALFDLLTYLIVQTNVVVAHRPDRRRDRKEQAPLEERPAHVDEASEDGGFLGIGARSNAGAVAGALAAELRSVNCCDCVD